MTLRARIVVTIIVGVLVTGSIVALGSFVLRKSNPTPPPNPIALNPSQRTPLVSSPSNPLTPSQTPPSTGNPPSSPTPSVRPPSPPLTLEAQLGSVAFTFAETYGSYSNQGGVENLERLRFLMSRSLAQSTNRFIAERTTSDPSANTLYYGITTRALSSRATAADDAHLQFIVQTQRIEVRGIAGNGARTLQELTIDFIREDGVWKVNTLVWGLPQPLSSSPVESVQP